MTQPTSSQAKARPGDPFSLQDGPVTQGGDPAPPPVPDLGRLPEHYGTGSIYLVGRDPDWLFAYWDVDWDDAELDRSALPLLRLFLENGDAVSETAVRHGDRHWLLRIPEPGRRYYAEIGWFSESGWKTHAASAPAATMRNAVSDDDSLRFGAVPFRESFERLVALTEIAEVGGENLMDALERLQERTDRPAEKDLGWTEEQRRVLDRLLGETVLERFQLNSMEIERLFRRSVQDAARGLHGSALFSRQRWDHLLRLTDAAGDHAGS